MMMFPLALIFAVALPHWPLDRFVQERWTTDTSQAVEAIERAYYTQDIVAAREVVAEIGDADPYLRAWAMWRLATMHPINGVSRSVKKINEARRKRLLEDAEGILIVHLDGSPDDAAATLVLSQVYQSRITGMMSGMRYGRRVGETLERALVLEPESPHALYHKGINQLMAPGPFGDKEQGKDNLEQAVALFEADLSSNGFTWGHAEALAFLGLALAKEGDMAGARAYYDRALTLEPGYVWVRDELLSDIQ